MTAVRPAVVVHGLTLAYRGRAAVSGLDGAFEAGLLHAVVGPNGAGKSTLLAALAGPAGALPGEAAQSHGRVERDPALPVAWLPQAGGPERGFPWRVHEFVAMGLWRRIGSFAGQAPDERIRVDAALGAVGLAGRGRAWLDDLSAGQRQRARFARLVLQDAGLILLDEPFNALDERTTADLLRLLARWRAEGRTVIAVLHDLDLVRNHFDRALLLAREAVAWGSPADVLRADLLRRARGLAEAWDDEAAGRDADDGAMPVASAAEPAGTAEGAGTARAAGLAGVAR